jgi:hypothetical protein
MSDTMHHDITMGADGYQYFRGLKLPKDREILRTVCLDSLADEMWITLREAKIAAKRFFEDENRSKGVTGLNFFIINAGTNIIRLVRIERDYDDVEELWNFGELKVPEGYRYATYF